MALLGYNNQQQPLHLLKSDRCQGCYICGSTGTGKSNLLLNMILNDIAEGEGVCVLDPHGDLVIDVLYRMQSRLEDVILLSLTNDDLPFGLNLYECPYPNDAKWVQYTVSQVMHIFNRLYDVDRSNPMMSQTLRNTAYTVIANGLTMAEIPMLLTADPSIRTRYLANVHNPQVQLFWSQFAIKNKLDRDREVAATLNKLDEMLQPVPKNIVGQYKSTIDIGQIMDQGKILLIKLDSRMEDMTSLVGSFVIAQILNAAYARSGSTVRRQFHVYADEFQRFATEDFATLLTEARKFGIGMTIAHQNISQISGQNRAAAFGAATHLYFRVNGEDSKVLVQNLNTTPPVAQVLVGYTPVMTYKQDVLGHLLHTGHRNPKVSIHIPMLRGIQIYFSTAHTWGDNLKLKELNELLFTAMSTKTYPKQNNFIDELIYLETHGIMHNVVSGLQSCLDALALDPILTDSGQYQPRYENQRQYADMANEIANRLASLPNYTAHVKMTSGEYDISPVAAPAPISQYDFEQRVRWIQQNNLYYGYVRQRVDVEREITARIPPIRPSVPLTKQPIPITRKRQQATKPVMPPQIPRRKII